LAPQDEDFAYLAHDLSQVLWAIQGRARALSAQLDPVAAAAVAAIAEDAAAAAAMLAARSAAGPSAHTDPDSLRADLQAVADVAWRQAQDRVAAMQLEPPDLHWEGPSPVPPLAIPTVVLRRILGNLLVNAVQAQPGGGAVACEATVAGAEVQVTVRDKGRGVPPTLRPDLFQPGATSHPGCGRGLGLAGARALARRWGGDLVLLESQGGACFRLSLPLAAPPASAVASGHDEPPCEAAPAGLRILVVDDELPVQEMLLDLLAVEGHRPTIAADHDSALASFAPDRYDAALIDLGLPGRPGDVLAAALRRLDPALAVILVTS
jgi:nitrogen-specific signal transduction histidine kinase